MSPQLFDQTYSLKAPENYQKYFVPVISKPLGEELLNTVKPHPGDKVLDVACGTGSLTRQIYPNIKPGGSITGLDINTGMLAIARDCTPQEMSIEWYEANAESIPFPDKSFDLVLCQISFQFMEDKLKALREMRRVLVPGGKLYLTLPGPMADIFAMMSEALDQHIGSRASQFVNHVFSLHRVDDLQQLLAESNFSDMQFITSTQNLYLPLPKDFLWQYIYSTPLAAVVADVDERVLKSLEKQIVGQWRPFINGNKMIYSQRIVTVMAQK